MLLDFGKSTWSTSKKRIKGSYSWQTFVGFTLINPNKTTLERGDLRLSTDTDGKKLSEVLHLFMSSGFIHYSATDQLPKSPLEFLANRLHLETKGTSIVDIGCLDTVRN